MSDKRANWVNTEVVIDLNTDEVVSREGYFYDGEFARCEEGAAADVDGGDDGGDSIVPAADFEGADEPVTEDFFSTSDDSSSGEGTPAPGSPAADDSQPADAEKVLQFIEGLVQDGEGSPAPDELKPPEGLSDDASARFQQLANQNREFGQQIGQFQEQNRQLVDYVQRLQGTADQTINQLQTQVAERDAQLKVLMEHVGRLTNPDQAQDPAERMQQDWLKRGQEAWQKELQPLRQELETLRQEKQRAAQNEQVRAEAARQRTLALQAADERLSMFSEDARKEIAPAFAALSLAQALQLGQDVQTGANSIFKLMCRFSAGLNRAAAAQFAAQQDRSRKAPPAGGNSRRALTDANGIPSDEELDRLGLDPLQYQMQRDLKGS